MPTDVPTLTPGLVSITFRSKTPAEVIALALEAQTPLLEWGGDVHVPHGDVRAAREVGQRTREAGLQVAAYGSYYRVGVANGDVTFEQCLASAGALGAPVVRVWAGACGSAETSDEQRASVVEDTRRICRMAASENINVAYEFHGGTAADTLQSTWDLLTRAGSPNLRTLWQPQQTTNAAERVNEIVELMPWLANVHVFQGAGGRPDALDTGRGDWLTYLPFLAKAKQPLGLLIEFVREGNPAQFLADAAVLNAWLAQVQPPSGDGTGTAPERAKRNEKGNR